MPALLELARGREQLRRQLLRRIGYTQGLFDIFRFEELIDAVADRLPQPTAAVDAAIVSKFAMSASYSAGIRDVAIALGLFARAGNRLTLGPHGRALLAIRRMHGPMSEASRSLLLARVIDADGEYTLTLLTIDASQPIEHQGRELFAAARSIINVKREWLSRSEPGIPIARAVTEYLEEIATTLESGRPQGGRRRNASEISTATFRHTVNPRRGWLADLYLTPEPGRTAVVNALRRLGQRCDKEIVLGLSGLLRDRLHLSAFPVFDQDSLWHIAASVRSSLVAPDDEPPNVLEDMLACYEHVRLRRFNQAETAAVFDYVAARWAAAGYSLTQEHFVASLQSAVGTDPGRIWILRARRGGPLAGNIGMRH
ncbi:MAG TPA: hypothetical protein VM305_01555 [Candidatus Limnocylindrales bacterium]|nr:hypothetical protein [Candidatus Limnocylindrales bacterium]